MKKRGNREYHKSKFTYILSWILNFIFAVFNGIEIISFRVLVGNYGWDMYAYLLRIIMILVFLILLNIFILLIFHFFKITYDKIIYWSGTLSFALLPYALLLII